MEEKPKRSLFLSLLIIFALGLLLGIGLCGLSFVLPSSDQEFHTNWLSGLSLLLMVLSFLALIGTLVIRVIMAIFSSSSPQSSQSQRIPEDSDDGSTPRS